MIRVTTYLVAIGAIVLAGCGTETKTDLPAPSKPALTFNAGVNRLHELRDSVKAAFDAGDPHACDGALHEAADILSALPQIAFDEGTLGAEGVATVQTSSKNLFDQFMKIHHGFHGDEEAAAPDESQPNAYDAVASQMDTALAALKGLVAE